jgi:hypothetical protein
MPPAPARWTWLRRQALVVGMVALLVNAAQSALNLNVQAVAQAAALGASASHTSYTPNTLARFRSTGDASGATPATRAQPPAAAPIQGPRTPTGKRPDQEPATAGAPLSHPITVVLDASLQSGAALPVGGGTPSHFASTEGLLALDIAQHSVDLSQAALVSAAPATPSATPSATPGATPGATPSATPGATRVTTRTPPTKAPPTTTTTSRPSGPLTLTFAQTQGGFPGASQQLAQFTLTIQDGQGHAVSGVRLLRPLVLTVHYLPQELAGLNTRDLRLVWLSTGWVSADLRHGQAAQSLPVTVDATTQILTAQLSSLQAGPLGLFAPLSDANAASSEHFSLGGNQGDLSFAVPLAVPPAAGGLTPPLELVYSSAGPNGRHAFAAPAPSVGDGWDLSLGSITYDSTTKLFYLNGIGGVSEPLLCCMTDGAGIQYYVPDRHPAIRVVTSPVNDPQPLTTSTGFIVRTPDGLEYDLGTTIGSRRTTIVNGQPNNYQWDLVRVVRPAANTPAGFLQQYTVSY